MTNEDQTDVSSMVAGWDGPPATLLPDAASSLVRDTTVLVKLIHDQCALLSKYAGKPIGVETLDFFIDNHGIRHVVIPRDLRQRVFRKAQVLEPDFRGSLDMEWLHLVLQLMSRLEDRLKTEPLDITKGQLSPSFPPDRIKSVIGNQVETADDLTKGISIIVDFSQTRLFAFATYLILDDVLGYLRKVGSYVRALESHGVKSRLLTDFAQDSGAWRLLISEENKSGACERLPYPLNLLK